MFFGIVFRNTGGSHRLQCVFREGKIAACPRKSSISNDTKHADGSWSYWCRGSKCLCM